MISVRPGSVVMRHESPVSVSIHGSDSHCSGSGCAGAMSRMLSLPSAAAARGSGVTVMAKLNGLIESR